MHSHGGSLSLNSTLPTPLTPPGRFSIISTRHRVSLRHLLLERPGGRSEPTNVIYLLADIIAVASMAKPLEIPRSGPSSPKMAMVGLPLSGQPVELVISQAEVVANQDRR